jgi:hypothetical protein
MREALGLTSNRGQRDNRPKQGASFNTSTPNRSGPDIQKRRFVRDGEVQVTMVSGTRPGDPVQQRRGHNPVNEHAEASQAALRAERGAREKAERAMKEAVDVARDLRTKLGHIALARDEAIETARRAEASRAALLQELETVRAQLSAEVSARARAERAAQRVEIAQPEPAPPTARPTPAEPEEPAAKRGRGRPRKAAPTAEPRVAAPKRKPGRPRVEKEPEPIKWWVPKRKPRAAKAPRPG